MSEKSSIPVLERPAFFDGQRLTAADLSAVQSNHRELRWLHNRALHNWGIAFGYEVSGKRGERSVSLKPGYALDCEGRDLILSETREEAIPAVTGPKTYYLTASYAEDEDLTPTTRQGLCDTSGAVRRPEEPIIQWKDPNSSDYDHGLDIVLASIEVENCQLKADVSSTERRDAVPAQQPYVAAGQTAAGETEWELWETSADADGNTQVVGVKATVSTTSAGFRTTPRYMAHITGPRVLEVIRDNEPVTFVADGYTDIDQATPFSFEIRMAMPQALIGDIFMNPNLVLTKEFVDRLKQTGDDGFGWTVVWLGVEE
jgi:hypothetical protein